MINRPQIKHFKCLRYLLIDGTLNALAFVCVCGVAQWYKVVIVEENVKRIYLVQTNHQNTQRGKG